MIYSPGHPCPQFGDCVTSCTETVLKEWNLQLIESLTAASLLFLLPFRQFVGHGLLFDRRSDPPEVH